MTSAGNRDPNRPAVFFDVDGTIVRSTIVHYYMYFRRRHMSPVVGTLWKSAFLCKCAYFLVLDRISRSRLNVVFYRSYDGMSVDRVRADAADCYRQVIEPHLYEEAARCIDEHREGGCRIVLVTGSIDFIMAPLAQRLGIDDVIAPGLVESNGRFTGELDGPPVGEEEKARRVRGFAEEHGIDLSQSHAYGDSIADLPMLETVGFPHAVNPDGALAATAARRGWPVHRWTVRSPRNGARP